MWNSYVEAGNYPYHYLLVFMQILLETKIQMYRIRIRVFPYTGAKLSLYSLLAEFQNITQI